VRLPRDRFDYSPFPARPPWKLPKGARIAVWTIVNIEEWDIEKAMARQYLPTPQGVAVMPDVPTGRGTTTGCGWASGGCWMR
jgi:allantoinase